MESLTVLGRDIHYREIGSGDTLLLFHGFGGSHLDWDLIAKDLSSQHRVLLPSLSNHYLDLKEKLNFDQLVELLGGFIRQIYEREGKPITIGGASFGAALAWGIAIQFPDYVKKLVLVSPMPPNPGERLKDFKLKQVLRLAKFPAAIAAFLISPFGRLMVPYLENIFQLPWAKSKKRRNFAFLTDRKVKVISHSISRFYWIMSNTDWIYWESRLGSIQQTVLVLWGDHDTLFGEKEIQRFSKIMPNAELRTIVGGGHAMTREAPGAIVREFRTL